jgi:sugar phosphate isomerase/epimerase
VEVSIQQAAALAADLGGLPALSQWLDQAGVRVEQFSGIIPAGPVLPAPLLVEADAFTASLPGLTHRLEVAAALDCHRAAIVVNPRSDLHPAQAHDLALSRLDLLATRAARHQITLAVEFIAVHAPGPELDGTHPFIRGPGDLLDLLNDLGRPDVGVLLDLCHLYAAGTTLAAAPALAGRIAFVQVCDIPSGTPPERMSDTLRTLPGTGSCDYQQLAVTWLPPVRRTIVDRTFSRWLWISGRGRRLYASTAPYRPPLPGELR